MNTASTVLPAQDASTAAVVLRLRNLADSIEGGTGADAVSVKSAVLIIESGSGELLPFTIGDNTWADHPGILFLGDGQVELVSVDDLQC